MRQTNNQLSFLGKNMRYLRFKYNMSQEQAAESLGCCKSTLSKYESGKTKRLDGFILLKAASLWNYPPQDLLYRNLEEDEKKGRNNVTK